MTWKIHDVFHVDLLTPYSKMGFHGPNFKQPPPDFINNIEEYEVEQVLDSWRYGHRCKVQYLVKWKDTLTWITNGWTGTTCTQMRP